MSRTQRILITGASRGLGRALAEHYAEPDRLLLLTATSKENLDPVAQTCRKAGADVICFDLDLSDSQSTETFAASLKESPNLYPDLYIANAGLFSGRQMDGSEECWASQQKQLSVNLTGTIQLTEAVAEVMSKTGRGHIALVSSLAAIQPQADSTVYCASKAGLAAYGKSRRIALEEDGIKLSILYPGHIQTDQTIRHKGSLPGLISAQEAAARIAHALTKEKRDFAFPRHIHWLVLLSNLLPWALQKRVNAPFRFRVQQENAAGEQPHD